MDGDTKAALKTEISAIAAKASGKSTQGTKIATATRSGGVVTKSISNTSMPSSTTRNPLKVPSTKNFKKDRK